MPTYEYECEKCGIFEAFQKMSDEKLTECPTCGGPVERLIGLGGGVIFKGKGFHCNDYKTPTIGNQDLLDRNLISQEDIDLKDDQENFNKELNKRNKKKN